MEVRQAAVLGAGLMGRQISMQCALHGFPTCCYEIADEARTAAEEFAAGWLKKRVEKGKMTPQEAEAAAARLRFVSDMAEAVGRADIVIEAVPDVAEIKRRVWAECDRFAPAHALYGSNSSYIVSSQFCDAVADPSRMCNMHFFNPALVMKTVEVVKGPHTAQATVDAVFAFAQAIGKEPVTINKEIYGFVVNRIFSAMTREACYLVDMGVASPEDIDKACRGALGHAMGPLETLDMTGIDLEYTCNMEHMRATGDRSYLPAACLTERYGRGEFGRKTGKGFYEYERK